MASPYFSPINLPTQDFSAIRQAGESWGRAYQQAGQAIGQIGSAYFKRKGMEKQASQFIKSDMGKDYLRGMGWDEESINKIDNDPKEAEKLAYDAIREAGGVENVEARMLRMQQAEIQKQQEQIQLYNFNAKKRADRATRLHNKTLMQQVPNEEYTKIEKEISENRKSMQALARSGDPDLHTKVNNYMELIKAGNEKLKNISPTVSMYELDPKKFDSMYGTPKTPEQMQLKQQTLMQLQKRQDELGDDYVERETKKLALKNAEQAEQAEQLVPSFVAEKRYVFSEAERQREVQKFEKSNNAQFTKEQRDSMASTIRLIEPKEIMAEKQRMFKNDEIDKDNQIIKASEELFTLLDADQGITDKSSIEKYARMLQPTGILTDNDLARIGGSPDVANRIRDAFSLMKDGTMSPENEEMIKEAAELLRDLAVESKLKNMERQISTLSTSYDVDPEIMRDRFYKADYNDTKAYQDKIKREKNRGKDVFKFETNDGKKVYEKPDGTKYFVNP